jgi:hypothetical protein
LQKQYRYDPELGRRGGLLLSCEETALMEQWLSDGHVGMWVPQSRVEHMIMSDRLELDYVRRFFFDLAKSKRPQEKAGWPFMPLFRSVWYACLAMKYQAMSIFYSRATRPYRWMKCLARISYCWGRVESQCGGFLHWLKPAALRRLEQGRQRPRFKRLTAASAAATTGDEADPLAAIPGPVPSSEREAA